MKLCRLFQFYKHYVVILFCVSLSVLASAQQKKNTMPLLQASAWKDIDGNTINAHGAGILFHDGIYYLFGEIKKGKTTLVPDQSWEAYRVPASGISCYISKDLINWIYKGVALKPNTTDSLHDLHTSRVIERPKVLYNRRTGKFVMWMHLDKEDYSYAHVGIAVSDRPEGPYEFIESMQPNGNQSRDMTVYKDDDEKAYLLYASEKNQTMHISQLSDDYLKPTKYEKRILINKSREAPAVFKHQGTYYLITSACTGWSPNEALYSTADSLMGEWKEHGNPCAGKGADSTFGTQGTFVLPIEGKRNMYLFLADRWKKTDLPDSRYVWLPLQVKDTKLIIEWEPYFISPVTKNE